MVIFAAGSPLYHDIDKMVGYTCMSNVFGFTDSGRLYATRFSAYK